MFRTVSILRLRILLVAGLMAVGCLGFSQATSTFTSFDAPGVGSGIGQGTYALGIDASGNILGIYMDANFTSHGYVRSAAGTITVFDAPGAGTGKHFGTTPVGIDTAGDIGGLYVDSNGVNHGFFRSSSGTITTFDVPGASIYQGGGTSPVGIDAAGDIIGVYQDTNRFRHGFVRTAAGTITTFNALSAADGTTPAVLNATGEIAGTYRDSNEIYHGFLRSAAGTITSFDVPGIGSGAGLNFGPVVVAIDAVGDVTGLYEDAANVTHGFVLTAGGTMSTFSAPGAGILKNQGTYPVGIDAAGDVAGLYKDSSNVEHGFFRAASGTISVFDPPGASMVPVKINIGSSGGHVRSARVGGTTIFGINTIGSVLGFFVDSDAVHHGFVRAASGSITVFDAPDAGFGAYQGTGGFAINTAGSIAGTYADGNSVLHGFALTLSGVATTTTLTASQSSTIYGEAQSFSVTVAPNSGSIPNGEAVLLMDGATVLGTGTLNGGSASFTTTEIPGGSNSITALYGGDLNFAGSASNAVSESVTAASSTTTLTGTPNPSSLAELVTLRATVSGQYGGVASGTVTFMNGSTVLGSASLTGSAAVFTTQDLPQGTDTITAAYGGNASLIASSSSALSQVVSAEASNPDEWAWMGGNSTVGSTGNRPGIYGALGTPAATNQPGSRSDAASWTDSSGNFWLFGGNGVDSAGNCCYLNDLWKFSPATNEWTWMGGNSTIPNNLQAQVGVYGTLGAFAATNRPGGRYDAATWTDSSGNLWLLGGQGVDTNGNFGYLNDLWEYKTSTGQWAWISGSKTIPVGGGNVGVYGTMGTAATGNTPGSRYSASSWTDNSGNLWLFGGDGLGSTTASSCGLDDLWKFNPSTSLWTWMGGSKTVGTGVSGCALYGVYGTKGVAAAGNIPGGRSAAVSWMDSSGHFWLFGGSGQDTTYNLGNLNDLWMFNPSTNQWTWVSGSNSLGCTNGVCGQPGVYGTLGTAAAGNVPEGRENAVSWIDSRGNFWLLGGWVDSSSGYGQMNDFWMFNPTSSLWAWMGGSGTSQQNGVYGIMGVPSAGDFPGSRMRAASWTDNGGNLWLFGGSGSDASGSNGNGLALLNDLWRYQPSATYVPSAATPSILTAAGTYPSAQTVTMTDTTGGASIYYTTDGSLPTVSSTLYSGPVTVSTTETLQAVAVATGYNNSAVVSAIYIIEPPTAAPTFGIAGGAYAAAQTVAISDASVGATIYFTKDGTWPTVNSKMYDGPLTVSTTETLSAIAIAPGASASPVSSAEYLIGSSSTQLIYTVAGVGLDGYSGDGGSALLAQMNTPAATVFDSAGNMYIADLQNCRIRKVTAATGVMSTVVGTTCGFAGDGGLATSAEIGQAPSLALDSVGNIYIADPGNSRIRKVVASTGVITTIAGNGSNNYSGDNGPAVNAQFYNPDYLALDTAGNIYITDDYRIRKITASTGVIATIIGTGSQGCSGDNGAPLIATITQPQGIAFDSAGNLYFSDGACNTIRKKSVSNNLITSVVGIDTTANQNSGFSGDGKPATNAQLNRPNAIAFDSANNMYISDSGNSVVREVNASTGIISTVVGNHNIVCNKEGQSLSGDGGPATSTSLCYQYGISVDSANNLYVSDVTGRIRKVPPAGALPTAQVASPTFSVAAESYAGAQSVTLADATPGAAIYITMNGSTPNGGSAQYRGPINVSGNVTINAIAIAPGYLASPNVMAAYTITTPPTAVIETIAGTAGVGGFSGAGGLATSAELGNPTAVTVDASGNRYVADSNNNVIWEVAASTNVITIVAGNGTQGSNGDGGPAINAQLNYPSGLALDSSGNLYIVDQNNYKVRKLNTATGIITTVAGNGTRPNGGSITAAGTLATAAELGPESVAFDSTGNMYIADFPNFAVWKVSASTGILSVVAGNGSFPDFTPNGDGGLAVNARLNVAQALAFDSTGNLYIGDAGRIRKITTATGIITTIAGGSITGYSGDGGLATNAEIAPNSIVVDAAGDIYLPYNSRVAEISAATGILNIVAGNETWQSSGDGGSPTVAGFCNVTSLALDGSGNLYIADGCGSAVREVSHPSAPTVTVTPSALNITTAQGITVTVAVGGSTTPVATGTVTLTGGGFTSNAQVLTSGRTLFSIPAGSLAVGADSFVATYSPDAAGAANYNSATGTSSAVSVATIVAATPTFSPAVGTYSSAQVVTISDATAGAIIYYTTNGTTPTTSSTVYSGAITVSSTETIEAIAVAIGDTNSAVATAAYAINIPVVVIPTFSPAAGTYTSAQTVAISDATAGATIYYTTNGTAPTTSSTKYSGPFTASATETIEAFAVASGDTNSSVASAAYTINILTPTAATPTFSLAGGIYASAQTVTIADATSGATIYYTTNGTAPTTNSTKYSGAITVSSTETIEAIAVASGDNNSAFASATYVISTSAYTGPVILTVSPILAQGSQTFTITGSGFGAQAAYNGDSPYIRIIDQTGSWNAGYSLNSPADYVTLSVTSWTDTQITASGFTGQYGSSGWTLNSGDALWVLVWNPQTGAGPSTCSNVVVGAGATNCDSILAATPVISPASGSYTSAQSITLSDTTAGATIYYTTNGTVPAPGTNASVYSAPISVSSSETIEALAIASGFSTSGIATAVYTIGTPLAATPTFSPGGGIYTAAQTVTIADATSGATIYYTTNGTTPTTGSTKYTGAITVSATETIEAIAAASGDTNSAVASAAYTINIPVVATPNFSPASGTYTSAQTVSISDATAGATIYYTTNGTTPTTSSTVYSGPVTVSSSETIQAIAAETGETNSAVAIAAYTINIPVVATPTFSPAAGTYTSAQTVSISDATAGATIYYTTNGTAPTTSSTVYSGAITVSSTETIEAIAVATGTTNSAVATAAYVINVPVVATPTLLPAAGTYTSPQTVNMSDATPGATIYYTTNGTTPTTNSTVYSGAIGISSTETIEAIAVATGDTNSAVATASYVFNIATISAPVLSSMSPALATAGGVAFTLTVNGSGFNPNSIVEWGSTALTTTYVNSTQLTAQVTAGTIAFAGISAITIQNPTASGGTSNALQFEVDTASSGTPPTFTSLTASVAPGSTATYPVTLPSGATNVTASCLNLPAGSSCSYSATANSVTILTSASTPPGTYQITVVFTETVAGAATGFVLLPLLLLPLFFLRRQLETRGVWITCGLGMVLMTAAAFATGCGGGGSSSTTLTPTHQVTSSGAVTLTVQ